MCPVKEVYNPHVSGQSRSRSLSLGPHFPRVRAQYELLITCVIISASDEVVVPVECHVLSSLLGKGLHYLNITGCASLNVWLSPGARKPSSLQKKPRGILCTSDW